MSSFRTPPRDAIDALVNRNASAPNSSIISKGSTTLPVDLLIFLPFASRTRPCKYMVLNGTSSTTASCIIIMRATQKNKISDPVIRSEVGKKRFSMSFVASVSTSPVQPNVPIGQRPDENHVSRTSGSRVSLTWAPAICWASC